MSLQNAQFSFSCSVCIMGNSLGGLLGGNSNGNGYGLGPELQCCDAVVDPISLLTTIGAITAVSLFLRQAVIDNMVMARRKKRNVPNQLDFIIIEGKDNQLNCYNLTDSTVPRNCL